MPELQDDVELQEEELNEEELLSDDDNEVTISVKKKKRERKTFHKENNYFFDGNDDGATKAQTAVSDGSIKYTDGTGVDGLRVHSVIKGQKLDNEGGVIEEGTVECYVVARNKQYASDIYLEKLGYVVDLTFKKERKGRSASRIEAGYLSFGKLLAGMVDSGAPLDDALKLQWSYYQEGGKFAHYRDENGAWKEPTTD